MAVTIIATAMIVAAGVTVMTATIEVAIVIAEIATSAKFKFPKMMFFYQLVDCSTSSRTTPSFVPGDTSLAPTMSMSHCNKFVATDFARVMSLPALFAKLAKENAKKNSTHSYASKVSMAQIQRVQKSAWNLPSSFHSIRRSACAWRLSQIF